jgi:asparagine N-glycosylation enzyme membrane subunit Stt3
MKKRLIAALLVFMMLFLSGCMSAGQVYKETEDVDQSTRIISTTQTDSDGVNFTIEELQYIKDEQMFTIYFPYKLRPALDWLKANSRPSDKVLTWWDNGHVIRGYARREPIVYTPSRNILETVAKGKWDEAKLGPFSNPDDMTNVAYAFLADSPTITSGIMKRYGARFAFVARADQQKLAGMTMLLDENVEDYLDDLGEPKATVRDKVLFKMADGWTVKGFKHVYEDDYANIYEVQ